jgi:hypothetical protein
MTQVSDLDIAKIEQDMVNRSVMEFSLNFLDTITRKWAIMSQFESDLNKYAELKSKTDAH